jgi:hypothetical protein
VSFEHGQPRPGIGPTSEMSLRVSVATLTRVLLPHSKNAEPMVALEHKATLHAVAGVRQVLVRAQPFGGAVRILHFSGLHERVQGFHFDSTQSRDEADFRIFIQPTDWPAVRAYCLRELNQAGDSDLDADPARELVEEVEDALGGKIYPSQYRLKPLWTVLEDRPAPSGNVRAAGVPTVRVYRAFEALIVDPALCRLMLESSERVSGAALREMAMQEARRGGRGRANAVFAAPLGRLQGAYLALPPVERARPLPFAGTLLEGSVAAVLDGVDVPTYRLV